MTQPSTAPAYVSIPCTIGPHDECQEAQRPTQPVPGLIYLVCTCPCHARTTVSSTEPTQS